MKDDQFDEDLGKLRDFYKEQGYLDVEIAEDKITFDYPSKDRLVITIRVVEGRRYHIGDISFTGNKIYSERLLRLVPRQRKGMIFSPSKLDKDIETLEETAILRPASGLSGSRI
jgi:outer membrane protein insertion porin family